MVAAREHPMSKRSAAADDTAATSKKFRSAIDDSASEFLCPITQELPLDPVTAEDGHVYERASIEQWLRQKRTSPVTNLAMSTKLFPAVQVRSAIHKLVLSGAISGDKAEKWQEKIKEEEKVRNVMESAEGGSARAMNQLGYRYNIGKGVKKDQVLSMRWFRRAAEHGLLRGLTNLAFQLSTSSQDHEHLVHLAEAATRGDMAACMKLAGTSKWAGTICLRVWSRQRGGMKRPSSAPRSHRVMRI